MQYSSGLTQYQHNQFGGFDTDEVKKEIHRGKRLVCSSCHEEKYKVWKERTTAATAGCLLRKCQKTFHFYCARLHAITSRRKKKGKEVDLYRVFCSEKHKQEYQKSERGKQEYSCSETDEEADAVKTSESDSEASFSEISEEEDSSCSTEDKDVLVITNSERSDEDDNSTNRKNMSVHGNDNNNNDDKSDDDDSDDAPAEMMGDHKKPAEKEASGNGWTSSDTIPLGSAIRKRKWRRTKPFKQQISSSQKRLRAKRKFSVLDSSSESSLDSVNLHRKKEVPFTTGSDDERRIKQDKQTKCSSRDKKTVKQETQKNKRSSCKKTSKQKKRRSSRKMSQNSDSKYLRCVTERIKCKVRPRQTASSRHDSIDSDDQLPLSSFSSRLNIKSEKKPSLVGQVQSLRVRVSATGFDMSSDVCVLSPHSEVQKDAPESPSTELPSVDAHATSSDTKVPSDEQNEQTRSSLSTFLETDKFDSSGLDDIDLHVLGSWSKSTKTSGPRKRALQDVEWSNDSEASTPDPFLSQKNEDNANLSVSTSRSHSEPMSSGTSVEKIGDGSKSTKNERPAKCLRLSDWSSVAEENTPCKSNYDEKEVENSLQPSCSEKLKTQKESEDFGNCPLPQVGRKEEHNFCDVTENLDISDCVNPTTNSRNELLPHFHIETASIKKQNECAPHLSSANGIGELTDHNHHSQKELSVASSPLLQRELSVVSTHLPQKEPSVLDQNHGCDKTRADQGTDFLTLVSQTDSDQFQNEAVVLLEHIDDKVKVSGTGDDMKVDGIGDDMKVDGIDDDMKVSSIDDKIKVDGIDDEVKADENVEKLTLKSGLDDTQEGTSSSENERKLLKGDPGFVQADQPPSSHDADCVLVIPAKAKHFERVAFDIQYQVAKEFNVERRQVHFWSAITPVLLKSECMLYYFNDIVSTLQNQDWDQLRQLLTDANTIETWFHTEYLQRMTCHTEQLNPKEREEKVAALVQMIVIGLGDAFAKNSCLLGSFISEFGVNFIVLVINNICDQDQILRKTLQQQSALYQWREAEVSFASFSEVHYRLLQSGHLQESLLLQNWFAANFSEVFKVVILPIEEVLLSCRPTSTSYSRCFAQLKSRMEELEPAFTHACESDLPVIVFIDRMDRDIVCFERYLQAYLKKYSEDFNKKRLICVFHVDNLSMKKCPQLDLGRGDHQVKLYTAFNPQNKPVTLVIMDVEKY